MTTEPAPTEPAAEPAEFRARLAEAEEALRAIRNGDVDAVVVAGARGEQVYALAGTDRVYRQLIETMSEGAVTLSADGVILWCNACLAKMLGRPLDHVLGTALRDCLPPAGQPALDAMLAQARTETCRREIILETRDGHPLPAYLSASRLHGNGTETVFCLVLTDLTEQKNHEQVVAAEHLARLILEQAAEAIVVCDAQGRVIRASQAAQQFCDGSPLPRPFAELFPLRADAAVPFQLAPVLQGRTLRNVDVYLDRQGHKADLILNAGPLLDGQQVLGCVITLTDVTERKRNENALWETRQRFHGLVEALYDLVWEVDCQGRYTYINPRIKDILGYEPEELLGKTPFDIMPAKEAQRASEIFGSLVAERKPIIALENINRHKDEHLVILETNGLPFYDAKGNFKGYRGTDRDITERKRAEAQLNEQLDELRRWHDVTLGRETRLLELKRDVNELLAQAGKPPRYASPEPDDGRGNRPDEPPGNDPLPGTGGW